MARRSAKVRYVLRQPNTGGHTCHWPGCKVEVPAARWGCLPHWNKLPKALKDAIWAAYRPGQEVSKTPSAEYVAAARAVQDWIKDYLTRSTKFGPLFDD